MRGEELPEVMAFWQSKTHEIDFVVEGPRYLKVKRGSANAVEFAWFPKSFPYKTLTVINRNRFSTSQITGVTLEDFLLDVPL